MRPFFTRRSGQDSPIPLLDTACLLLTQAGIVTQITVRLDEHRCLCRVVIHSRIHSVGKLNW